MKKNFLLVTSLSLFATIAVLSQTISYSSAGSTYTQNFDGLPNSGTYTFTGLEVRAFSDAPISATNMTGWYFVKNTGTGANDLFVVENGSGTSGGVKSYGTTSATDRALGGLGSGTYAGRWGALITNNTGVTLNKFTITFTGEQWRANNTSAQSIAFSYKVGATAINDASGFVSVSALNFTSPVLTTAGALDGNSASNRTTGITATVTGLTWTDGTVLAIRWTDSDDAGSDHGLAIDDLTFTADVQSSTNYYYKGTGDLHVAANWGTNTDGTGTNPSDFTSDYQIFNVRNATSVSTTASWTVSGTGSKIVVGDGTNPCELIVASGFPVTATVDVSDNATLTLLDATLPTFGNLSSAGTVSYEQSGTVVVTASTYGNLKLVNGTKTFASGTTTIAGNLTVDNVTDFNGAGSPFSTINLAGNLVVQNGTTFSSSNTERFTLVCNGSSQQTLRGNGVDLKVFRITVSNSAGVVLSTTGGSTNVIAGNTSGGGITLSSGSLTTNSNTVTLFTSASSSILSETSGRYIIGTVIATKTVGTGTSTVGNLLGTGGIAAGTDDLGDVTVTRVTGASGIVSVNANSGIARKFAITSTNPPVSGRDVTFSWVSDDDNGKTLTSGTAWKSTDNGTSWSQIASGDYSTRSVTLTGETSFGQYTFSDASNPLPVELTSFTAIVHGKGVALSWKTATEKNNYGFELERRGIGSISWQKVGFVAGAGNSNVPKEYSFKDNVPVSGTYFYRLKQIDRDGKVEYHNAIEVKVGSHVRGFELAQNHPNPFNPTTSISYALAQDEYVVLKVYDMLGKEIATLVNSKQSAGAYTVPFNASSLPSGIYFYTLRAGNVVESKKMVLMK